MDIGNSLARNARQLKDKIAVIYEDRTYTYNELNKIVNRFAHGMKALGIGKGDKVALMMKNSDYFPIAYFATVKLGGVIVPINCRLTKGEATYIIEHSDAKMIIADNEYADLLEQARTEKVEHIITIQQASIKGHLSVFEVLSNDDTNPDVLVNRDDILHILYTSGTTGKPKGAVFDHHRFLTVIFNGVFIMNYSENERLLHIAPFFHAAQLSILIQGIFLGVTNVIHNNFLPLKTLQAISEYQITHFFAVPTMYNMLIQTAQSYNFDLSSIKRCLYGAAPMAPELIKQSMKLFGTDQFYNACGLTEGGPGGIFLSPEEHKTKMGTSGTAKFLMEARVVDKNGIDISPGEIGELILRGESIMKEYYKNPEATADAIRDGWLYTGDLCNIDEDGFITLVDRGKDMIISGGSNVYSVEVEQVLYSFTAILEAAVIGVPDEKWGETVAAIIVAKPGYTIDSEQLKDFCRKHLAGYKIPRIYHFVDMLPRNASGKILKFELRKRFIESII